MLKQQHYTLTNVKKVKSQSTTPLIQDYRSEIQKNRGIVTINYLPVNKQGKYDKSNVKITNNMSFGETALVSKTLRKDLESELQNEFFL